MLHLKVSWVSKWSVAQLFRNARLELGKESRAQDRFRIQRKELKVKGEIGEEGIYRCLSE